MITTSGFIELHCHLREPGFEYKETIETGIAAAKAGGYGIICPMPNTNPVCDNVETLKYIKARAAEIGGVKVLPVCAMTKGLNSDELVDFEALHNAGAIAFSNDGRSVENMETFKRILLEGKRLGLTMMSHAENTEFSPFDNRSEYTAVKRELKVVEEVGGQLHFCHISTKESLELIRAAKKKGLKVTCETAPHYFCLKKSPERDFRMTCETAQPRVDMRVQGKQVAENFFTTLTSRHDEARFKMNPPLRSSEDVEAVIEALRDGTIDAIATDHAPHSFEEKTKPFEEAPFGIVGFETAFALGYTNLVRTGYLTLEQLLEKMIDNPARIIGVEPFGTIEIDLDEEWVVKASEFKTKAKISPFEGMKLYGKIKGYEYV